MLYFTMIQSHVTYCISTWCNGNKSTLLKIQRTANKFIRLIYDLDYRASVKDIMQRNNLLCIEQLMHLETACFMFKYVNDLLSQAFCIFLLTI